MSQELGELVVKNCTPEEFKDECDLVFSGLDSDVAEETGEEASSSSCGVLGSTRLTEDSNRNGLC